MFHHQGLQRHVQPTSAMHMSKSKPNPVVFRLKMDHVRYIMHLFLGCERSRIWVVLEQLMSTFISAFLQRTSFL